MMKVPTLVLDKQKCLTNIRKFAQKTRQNKLIFRPHFKTHQSAAIGEWFKQSGVSKITVSSLQMAAYFASAGWQDITIALPMNPLQIEAYNKLAQNITLNLLISTTQILPKLSGLTDKIGYFIELDNGYNRSGLDAELAIQLAEILPNDRFKGFLLHAGNTYNAKSKEQILAIHQEQLELAKKCKRKFPNKIISVGDTPSFSLASNFDNIDEVRPGNFVFFDVMQKNLGSCSWQDIAVAVFCPVIAKYEKREQLIINGGAVHLSKESWNGSFGRVAIPNENGWAEPLPDTYVKSVSQEHGIIATRSDILQMIEVGDVLAILPVHSCLTANLFTEYRTLQNELIDRL
jgi:D-serine deaminase-like pyridoxal phosphate-dependent protein